MSDHPILLNFVLSLYEQSNGDIHKMPQNLSQLYERAMEDVFKSCARIIKCNDLRNDQDSTLRIASSRIRVGSASSAQLSARECRLSHCEEDDTNLKIDTSKIASLIFDLAISVRAPPTRPCAGRWMCGTTSLGGVRGVEEATTSHRRGGWWSVTNSCVRVFLGGGGGSHEQPYRVHARADWKAEHIFKLASHKITRHGRPCN